MKDRLRRNVRPGRGGRSALRRQLIAVVAAADPPAARRKTNPLIWAAFRNHSSASGRPRVPRQGGAETDQSPTPGGRAGASRETREISSGRRRPPRAGRRSGTRARGGSAGWDRPGPGSPRRTEARLASTAAPPRSRASPSAISVGAGAGAVRRTGVSGRPGGSADLDPPKSSGSARSIRSRSRARGPTRRPLPADRRPPRSAA